MFIAIMFIVAQLGDLVTMLLLPPHSELHSAADYPILLSVFKLVLILALLRIPFQKYRTNVWAFAAVVGALGVGANLSVLLHTVS